MKYNLLLVSAFCVYSICFAQEYINKDSIQICYHASLDAIGGYDRCVTIHFEDTLMYCQRVCYRHFNDNGYLIRYEESEKQDIFPPPIPTPSCYYQSKKQAILRYYQENNNYLILDERVEISKSQFEELVKIIDEIKAFVPKDGVSPDEIIISTAGSHYVIKDKNGTTVIVDWRGRYNRCGDIEKALGLKNYSHCPCVEEDLKQMKKNRKKSFRRN